MKIITKFRLNTVFLIIMVLVVLCINLYLVATRDALSQKSAVIGQIVIQAIDINLVTNDYLFSQSERAYTQWKIVYKALSATLEKMDSDDKSVNYLLTRIKRNHTDMNTLFSMLTGLYARNGSGVTDNLDSELKQHLVSQLGTRAKDIVSSSEQLDEIARRKRFHVEKRYNLIVFLMVLSISIVITINIILISKSFTDPILTIHKGTRTIGKGNLDYSIALNTEDELSELADSINSMTHNLGKITVSSKKLEQEVEERKEIEQALKKTLEEKEILIREIHHRVKNNMQLIISMFNLQQEQLGPEARDVLKTISSRVRMFGSIYRKLYQQDDFSKIDLVKHLKESLPDLVKAYNVTGKDITLNLDISAPFFTLDQAIPCGLLLNELISNSLKHAFTDKGVIDIAIYHTTDGDIEHIVYKDNGRGTDQLQTGFGSRVIKALAKQLNLFCRQSTDGGLRYDFCQKQIEIHHSKKTGSILFVEDELLIALERTIYLKKEGYIIDDNVIISGDEAVRYVESTPEKPTLIMMDIGLKGSKNGIEAAREIRAHNLLIPIVFMSGYDDNKTQTMISDIPLTDYLSKICSNDEMKQKIDNYLNRQQAPYREQ